MVFKVKKCTNPHSRPRSSVDAPVRGVCAFLEWGSGLSSRKLGAQHYIRPMLLGLREPRATRGRAPGCNGRTAAILREQLPGYRVDWSDAGY
mgnify:CR=1 FL=1